MINYYFEGYKEIDINKVKISNWLERLVNLENFSIGELTFIFCRDEYLLNINKQYLDHNYFTDVITFDYSKDNYISGDVFISVDRVNENYKEFNVSFENEILRIMLHGVLHLLGYKDKEKSEKLLMTKKEDEYLNIYEDVE